MQLPNSVKKFAIELYFHRFQVVNKQELYSELKKQHDFHKIQRTNRKFLSVIIIIVFPYLTSTDNTVITSHSIPKESKALISFLSKLGTKTKLQSFNLNDILKGF